jgi:hypothetical protein
MTESPRRPRIAVVWAPEARADLRAIDRATALEILHCVDRYLANRTGEVKRGHSLSLGSGSSLPTPNRQPVSRRIWRRRHGGAWEERLC